jgi:hypothetical protein
MAGETERQVPDGAAVFPLIPEELGVNPLLLAFLHAAVFLAGSGEAVINPAAADEAIEYCATYLQRLSDSQRDRLREDLTCLVSYARQEHWPKQDVASLQSLLAGLGLVDEN